MEATGIYWIDLIVFLMTRRKPLVLSKTEAPYREPRGPLRFKTETKAFLLQGPLYGLFILWMLSIPFHQFSIIKTYSLDNLLAPILLIGGFLFSRIRNSEVARVRSKSMRLLVVLYVIYAVAGLVPMLGSSELFWHRVWMSMRVSCYFFIPMLYIRDARSWRDVKALVLYIACMGAATAFLVSIDVLNLGYERFEASRIGVDWLPKSIGVFGNYGDMAMLYGFSAVALVSHFGRDLNCGISTRIGKPLIWAILLLGVLGSQSRNMIISTIIALIVYWFSQRYMTTGVRARTFMLGQLTFVGIIVVGILIVFGGSLADSVSHWGGEGAYQTAQDRISSFQQAITLILQNPFFGISGQRYSEYRYLVEETHNMWLLLLLERGIIGFFSILAIFIFAVSSGLRAAKQENFVRDGSLVLGTLSAVFVAVEFYPGVSDVLMMMLSICISSLWIATAVRVENE